MGFYILFLSYSQSLAFCDYNDCFFSFVAGPLYTILHRVYLPEPAQSFCSPARKWKQGKCTLPLSS